MDITAFVLSVGTLFVGLSFAYGKTLQEVFDSLYMLYFVQPFDVGDIISVADGPHLRAEQVGILTSYFLSPGKRPFLSRCSYCPRWVWGLFKK
jgi:small-conductance mechanosensitive channel